MTLRRSWHLTLILGWLVACGSDEDPKPRTDAAVDDATTTDSGTPPAPVSDGSIDSGGAIIDASAEASAPDAAGCVAKGCDELGYECGMAVDNCGNPLNCNKPSPAPVCPKEGDRCGGDSTKGPNACGCLARANPCQAQGAQCGAIDECGTVVQCGDCPNGGVCTGNNMCTCTPNSNPCGDKVCGMAADGCGGMRACGANNGQCTVGACSAEGQCACRPREQACMGKTGTVTENGCTYNCDTACVPDNAAACAGAECGTATNNCGDVVNCGASAGACAAGNACVGGQFVTDNTLPPRTAAYQGGYCVPTGVSKLLGKYAARAHGFRQGGTLGLSVVNRAEAVSLLTVTYTRASQKVQMKDVGCVATTISAPGDLKVDSVLPSYRKLEPITVDLTVSGSNWSRPDVPNPAIGAGVPNGFTLGMPAFCAGKEGMEVELPAGDPRRGTFWANNRCTCPTTANANTVPTNVYETAVSRDCRLNDSDGDGKPGFTVYVYPPLGVGMTNVYNANVSHGIWSGVIRDDRFHIGTIGEAKQPMERAVLGCEAKTAVCGPPQVDCGCRESQQPVQFVPLPDNDPLSCDGYYNMTTSPRQLVKQTVIDAQFGKSYGSCTAAGQCPSGAICRQNACVPMTNKSACTPGSTTSGPCSGGTGFCEACPSGMECKSDGACWPTANACPVPPSGQRIGDLCIAP
jgi:hypothetical protein